MKDGLNIYCSQPRSRSPLPPKVHYVANSGLSLIEEIAIFWLAMMAIVTIGALLG